MSNKWNLIFIQIKWFTWFHLLEVIRTLINVIMPSKKGFFYRNLLYLYTVLHIWCYKNFLTVFLPVLISFCLFISLVMSLTQSILFCLQSTGTSEICMNMPFRLAITMPASTDCGTERDDIMSCMKNIASIWIFDSERWMTNVLY